MSFGLAESNHMAYSFNFVFILVAIIDIYLHSAQWFQRLLYLFLCQDRNTAHRLKVMNQCSVFQINQYCYFLMGFQHMT